MYLASTTAASFEGVSGGVGVAKQPVGGADEVEAGSGIISPWFASTTTIVPKYDDRRIIETP